jgi:hypothetical protein
MWGRKVPVRIPGPLRQGQSVPSSRMPISFSDASIRSTS